MVTDDAILWEPARRLRLVRYCAAVSGDREAAEDLAQETLLEAWRNSHKLVEPAGADRWLAAIARNVCLRWARRRSRRSEAVLVEPAVDLDLEADLTRSDLTELIDRALATLPPETREALVEKYVNDASLAEIAERLGLSEAAVGMRLVRGRAALARLLEDELHDEPADGWQRTRMWCRRCGRGRLDMRRDGSPQLIAFRCPACHSEPAALEAEFRLDNPVFRRIAGGLKQPAAIRSRFRAWAADYHRSATESGGAPCTRCGNPVRLLPEVRGEIMGVFGECERCREQVWLAATGVALALPGLRGFLREHHRTIELPARELDFEGRPALLVAFGDLMGSARAEVVFSRETMQTLHVEAA